MEWCRVFFCSSRRRHTRFSRDWSSDVCSSDLSGHPINKISFEHSSIASDDATPLVGGKLFRVWQGGQDLIYNAFYTLLNEIGRASCRERVLNSMVAVSVKK